MTEKILPRAYVNRRFHSLAGIWLVIFLLEHLITNSQAALYIGDWGQGFVKMVNDIHDMPYLQAIEILFLGFPIVFHAALGIKYIFTSKSNAFEKSKHKPKLSKYSRNHAFSWQRLTSWVLLLGIVLHVIQMRFMEYPISVKGGIGHQYYMVRVNMDPGLYKVAARLQAHLYNEQQVQKEKENLLTYGQKADAGDTYEPQMAKQAQDQMLGELLSEYVEKLSKKELGPHQVIAVSQSFGVATLLSVRQTFKSPLMITLYTIFVIAACYHAFNGLWSAMIAWGVTLSARSQQVMRWIAIGSTIGLTLLGLAAIWLTYLVNLR
ncbi:MAG: hypothetical protein S4CHLAM6_05390 [Chlamydiae bacterium]|nr:hypothetical protein [Chlamydiota bacterium]